MKRKILASLATSAALLFTTVAGASEVATFKDVEGHWAAYEIGKMVELGIIKGFPDQTFQPDKAVTRAELTSILVHLLGLPIQEGKVYGDTQNHWAKDIIATAYQNNLIKGDSNNRFRPDEYISREEMAVIIANAMNLSKPDQEIPFVDIDEISPWAKEAVFTVHKEGIITGYPNDTFRPKQLVTRADVAKTIDCLLNN